MPGEGSRFKKGSVPWNKGLKGIKVDNQETRFKKGMVPKNQLPVGHERLDSEGYIYIKVAHGLKQFRPKHHVIYEQHTGNKIPKGHAIVLLDDDRTNCDFENLALVSRGELAALNRKGEFKGQPPEIKKALIALVRLDLERNKIERSANR